MPLNSKGMKIKGAMEKEYGEKKGDQVFYASENKGKIKGVKKHISKKEALEQKKRGSRE
jgi:predicted ribosome-associated RNA-binding protein Tma20